MSTVTESPWICSTWIDLGVLEEQITIVGEANSHVKKPARPAPAVVLVAVDARL